MVNEPTREEIQSWRERLDDREFQRALLRFQDHVYQIFEDLRKQTGLELIRAIIARDEVKGIESVVEKIIRKREEQGGDERPWGFEDVKDLVGIKILCPYQNDVDEVVKYLFSQNGRTIRILEGTPAEGWRADPSGYKGYNFTVYPAAGAPAAWTTLYCEIQVKTIIQEAWDAKTHDLTYKRKKAIPPGLQEHFSGLSDLLDQAERYGERVRQDIDNLFAEVAVHKEAAAKALLAGPYGAIVGLRQLAEHYDVPIIEGARECAPDEVSRINEALRNEKAAGRLNRQHCALAGFLALCHKDPGQTALALQLCNDFSVHAGHNPQVEILRGAIYWALSRFVRSVEHCERALYACRDTGLTPEQEAAIQSDFCYYVTDATVFYTYVAQETVNRVRELSEVLLNGPLAGRSNTVDTAGFVKIVLGRTSLEVNDGMGLVRRARQMAQDSGNPQLIQMAEAFCSRHLRLGQRRLDRDFQ